jgi:hypothetical protein
MKQQLKKMRRNAYVLPIKNNAKNNQAIVVLSAKHISLNMTCMCGGFLKRQL